jgi:excisionase family DNA binding protein
MEKRNEFPDRPWTISEVADYLQVSERTVENRIEADGLPVTRLGGLRRFIRADIDAWLREQTRPASDTAAA